MAALELMTLGSSGQRMAMVLTSSVTVTAWESWQGMQCYNECG